ncbi:hypothetical protein Acsp01_47090 [Actinoplanes sp. NBRC 101535]|nr:hypothetical protein Acsp01_47090 [Actinoplanes sp. NBRC 101535]
MGPYLAHALALSAEHGPGPWPDGGEPTPAAGAARPLISDTVGDGIRTHHMAPTNPTRTCATACSPSAPATAETWFRVTDGGSRDHDILGR